MLVCMVIIISDACFMTVRYIGEHNSSKFIFTDIDECSLGTTSCNQVCYNTEGSFICTCYDGYQLHHDDTTMCVGKIL